MRNLAAVKNAEFPEASVGKNLIPTYNYEQI